MRTQSRTLAVLCASAVALAVIVGIAKMRSEGDPVDRNVPGATTGPGRNSLTSPQPATAPTPR